MEKHQYSKQRFFNSGTPWVWLNAGAVSISMIMVVGLLILIAVRGLGHFWPKSVWEIEYRGEDSDTRITLIGERIETERVAASQLHSAGYDIDEHAGLVERTLLKTGNRDVYGFDFRLIVTPFEFDSRKPKDIAVLERTQWGNFYGYPRVLLEDSTELDIEPQQLWREFELRLKRASEIREQIKNIEKDDIGAINYQLERLRLKKRELELEGNATSEILATIENEKLTLEQQYSTLKSKLDRLYTEIKRDSIKLEIMTGERKTISLADIVKAYRPNHMSIFDKSLHYIVTLVEFVSTDPREANTEGGIFPAIFGTVTMVLLMSVLVMPFGVVAAVYLREYAKQGFITRLVRISVNNLAGVPSIVYGVFGLGFFVYLVGGKVDELFYPEALPAPTFGSGGLLWASLTLALLTVPVVIVATEEGLSRIPRAIREGSLALGATKAETLWRTVIPMSSPAIMTGLILAVARAAGEVAPLMLVGAVKLAPSLPIDLNAPFFHLERKFMHLGFHIYDVGFQSPNVEAARPLVYATALILVLVIVGLNLTAIYIRNHLRERYRMMEH
jgi:phosphate transport system permease protein